MGITRTVMVDDDGSGTTGTVLNNAWLQTIYNQIDAALGVWSDVPFVAGSFTATPGMTWSVSAGNVAFDRYTVIGKTLIWLVYLEATTIGGTPGNQLFIKLPAGLVGVYRRGVTTTGQLYDGASNRGWVRVGQSGDFVIIEKDPANNFTVNTGTTYVQFCILIEVT